jgi:hypothetical protein
LEQENYSAEEFHGDSPRLKSLSAGDLIFDFGERDGLFFGTVFAGGAFAGFQAGEMRDSDPQFIRGLLWFRENFGEKNMPPRR